MKILVTGASGFVGSHLVRELSSRGHVVMATAAGTFTADTANVVLPCDITDREAVRRLVAEAQPEAVVHLAGISHVVEAGDEKSRLSHINIGGTENLCSACTDELDGILFLFVSSAHVFRQGQDEQQPIRESSPLEPVNAYGQSKLAGEYIVRTHASASFRPWIVRPFNHIGPGQAPGFVCPSLARRIVDAEDGGTISVGNLNAFRDFTDVRDIVRAYRLILEKRPRADLFVLGSGRALRIRDVLDEFIRISGKSVEARVETALLRENDPVKLEVDSGLARRELGWECDIPMAQTLEDIYRDVSRNDR